MTGAFYDRIAGRRQALTPEVIQSFRTKVENPDPEERFTKLVTEAVTSHDTVVDLGTGDGSWFANNVGPRVARAVGIDTGRRRIEEGAAARRRARWAHAELVLADAQAMPLSDGWASVVISRRGPLSAEDVFMREACRVLRLGGSIFEIAIGEHNAREVTATFGRSQMMDETRLGPRLPRLEATYRAHGLEPFVSEDYHTYEYFPGRAALEYRLLSSPILEHFDPDRDAALVDELAARNTTARGIRLTFHRLIIAARRMS